MNGHGLIATLALLAWFPLSIAAFYVMRPSKAAVLIAFGAVMFLPELAYLKLPRLPNLDKHTIPYLCILLGCLIRSPRRVLRAPPDAWFSVLMVVLVISAVGMVVTNRDALIYGSWITRVIPGLTLKDGLATAATDVAQIGIPFFVGSIVFRTSRDARGLLHVLAIAAVLYAGFILVELRMSPQFHRWIYGYSPIADFSQTRRWGGYRPNVFMAHGIALSLFVLLSLLAAIIVARTRRPILGVSGAIVAAMTLVLLVLCKSTAALTYALVLIPVLWWARAHTQIRIAVLAAGLVSVYPLLRASDTFPTKALVSVANHINADRAASLQFRFHNEDLVLEKARERVVFGWGTYGRNAIYDPLTAKQMSVTDGYWIIRLGRQGVVGLLCTFAILLIPVFMAARKLRRVPNREDQLLLAGLCVILMTAVTDLIPNGLFSNYPYFIAGAVAGLARCLPMRMTSHPAGVTP